MILHIPNTALTLTQLQSASSSDTNTHIWILMLPSK